MTVSLCSGNIQFSDSLYVGAHDESRDSDHAPGPSVGGALRDDKQETVVVRPYPQAHGAGPSAPTPMPQHLTLQPGAAASVSATSAHLPQVGLHLGNVVCFHLWCLFIRLSD